MISKKEFVKFCYSLNAWQKRLFVEIIEHDIDDILNNDLSNETRNENQGIFLFLNTLTTLDVINKPTKEIYKRYYDFCMGNEIATIGKVYFSKMVKEKFDIDIVDKKIKGKKYRIFVAKDGAADESK